MVFIKGSLLLLFLCLVNHPHGSCGTDQQDVYALKSLSNKWRNGPPSWGSSGDPCDDKWEGIKCINSRVTELKLFSMGLKGTMSDDIGNLSELERIDFSSNPHLEGSLPPSIGKLRKLKALILIGCKFTGSIPDEIGNLLQLQILSLNANHFTGSIPPSLGKLSSLKWLDLANNQLNGTLPTSQTEGSGLDQLVNTLHFHLNKNKLQGTIPESLFSSKMSVIHILLDRNNLSGEIPESIGQLRKLEVLRLDNNSLNGSVPASIRNLTLLKVLNLANNKLTGPLPNMTAMHALFNLDLSNNSFDPSEAPFWFSDVLQNLTTLIIESGGLKGELPETLFSFPKLQEVRLNNNLFNGSLNMGSNFSNQLTLVNFQYNSFTSVMVSSNYNNKLVLVGNPVCNNVHIKDTDYCKDPEQDLVSNFSDNNNCSYAYEVKTIFRAPYFSYLNDSIYTPLLQKHISNQLKGQAFSIHNYSFNEDEYLQVQLKFCPSSSRCFTENDILETLDLNSKFTIDSLPEIFGPFYFLASEYMCKGRGMCLNSYHELFISFKIILKSYQSFYWLLTGNKIMIIALVIGFAAAAIAIVGIACYAIRQKKQAQRAINLSNPFASWGSNGEEAGDAPYQKSVRYFSFEELRKSTKNFSNSQVAGSGGYGKVYKGILSGGEIVAIKRLQKNSLQGGLEFKTEIESLSRVHHKNLIELIGFCYEEGERMLVYEYISNGTLSENLSENHRDLYSRVGTFTSRSRLGVHLNFKTLLHLIEIVLLWAGYLDPEYFRTNQLTIKSDVFSFGVVMLEIITGKSPLKGKRHIVGEVENAVDWNESVYYGLEHLVDQVLLQEAGKLVGFKRFVDLALRCTEMCAEERPSMDEVAKELAMILKNLD
ncbi:putative leucine-rich repeat receptor-like protein kinase [Canna indica]|uniref:Leucine-rich repeat receptor-like protein kinase n=1 Tax=Canna indica TaxID=4628 RepID=A0AAQ3JTV2_9LILI|nr:putative leucine-rich repeat receptor-like protein kinase [Canna indica]